MLTQISWYHSEGLKQSLTELYNPPATEPNPQHKSQKSDQQAANYGVRLVFRTRTVAESIVAMVVGGRKRVSDTQPTADWPEYRY